MPPIKPLGTAVTAVALLTAGCMRAADNGGVAGASESRTGALTTGVNVTTNKNNNARTASNTAETWLTPQNVKAGSFGRLYTRTVRGNILTQPLYIGGVTVSGVSRDAVFVTTSENDVYAFDADNTALGATTGLLWQTNLGTPPANWPDWCNQAPWRAGILSTPVIDVANNVMFVIARAQVACDATHTKCDAEGSPACTTSCRATATFIKKLNLSTGAVVASAEIAGSASGVTFDSYRHHNRPGLLLQNGVIYIGFGTRGCDSPPFQGWVFGYRGSDLARVAVYTAGAPMAGIWQSGHGLAGDANNVYVMTGNADNDDNKSLFHGRPLGQPLNPNSNSFLRLAIGSGGELTLGSKYTPDNNRVLNKGDTDLGSGGPVLLPGGTSGNIIGGGKEGVLYFFTRSLSLFRSFQASWHTWHPPSLASSVPCYLSPAPPFAGPMYPDKNGLIFQQVACPAGSDPAQVCESTTSVANCGIRKADYEWGQDPSPNIHGGPAFWQSNSTTGYLYLLAEKDYLKAFKYDIAGQAIVCGAGSPAGECNPTMTSATVRSPDGMPGGAVSVSSSGTTNGIVWSIAVKIDGVLLDDDGKSLSQTGAGYAREGQDKGKRIYARLVASDALTLKELWRDDTDVPYTKFMPPTVAGGLVFRPTVSAGNLVNNPKSYLIVYGPLSKGKLAQTAGAAIRMPIH